MNDKRNAAVSWIIAGFLASVSLNAAAYQDAATIAPRASKAPSASEVVNMLSSKLSLTDQQKSAITPIIADRQEKMRAMMSDSTATRAQKGQQMRALMSDSDQKINAILTPDQQAKYAQIEQQMRDQMKARMQQNRDATSN